MNKIKLFLAIKFFKSLKIKLLGQKSLIFEKVWFSNFFGRKVWFWLKKVWFIKLFKLLTFFHKKVEKVWFQTFLAEKSDFFQKSLKIKLFKLFTTYSNFRKKFNLFPPPRATSFSIGSLIHGQKIRFIVRHPKITFGDVAVKIQFLTLK